VIEALDIEMIWLSPLAGREQLAFRRALADRLADRLAVAKTDREAVLALKRRLAHAWKSNRTELFVGAGLALRRINGLKAPQAGRLTWALLTLDRFTQAREVSAIAEDDNHLTWFDRARAAAGCKRLDEALEAALTAQARLRTDGPGLPYDAFLRPMKQRPSALDRACRWWEARDAMVEAEREGRPNPEAPVLDFLERRTLLLIEAIEAASETDPPADWPSARRRATASMLLGLETQAEKLLTAVPPAGVVRDLEAKPGPLLRAVSATASAGGQAELLRLFGRLAYKTSVRTFTDLALKVMAGEAPWQDLAVETPPNPEAARMAATAFAGAGRLEPAIALFGALTRGKRRQPQRADLSACISRQTVAETGSLAAPSAGRPRIFDIFPYNGELELLKIKLNEMAPWVDRFVIVESAVTFTGQPKALTFPDQRAELGPFLDKISYLALQDFPEYAASAWPREFHQRDLAMRALREFCGPDDIVLISDTDEVIAQSALDHFDGEMGLLAALTCRYFLNHAALEQRTAASIWRAGYLERWGPSFARNVLAAPAWTSRISDGGWHFTSVGDARAISRKLSSYSHTENDRPDSEAVFGALLDRIRTEGPEPGWRRAEVEELPAYVQQNRQALADLIL
jgi:beta-1,4-mannosyl-glycoprotein beta-1,4-N-acetylglucosaminyltransferase